jgi:hypothetical protein
VVEPAYALKSLSQLLLGLNHGCDIAGGDDEIVALPLDEPPVSQSDLTLVTDSSGP